jgi:FAD/FMN-containing dehydrogenase
MNSFFSDYQPVKTERPTSPEQVQEVIFKANRDRTPLVLVSSGTNLQDTHLPSVKNAISVDLSQMNRILYLDHKNRNAVIEPGVTFRQLEAACTAKGLRTLSAIDVPESGSVLGTYLEMMPLFGWTKYHPWEILTMRGFRADGKPFATGQMAMSQDRPDKYVWGVSYAQVSRLFCQAQGTLGIITATAVTVKTATTEDQVLFFPCKGIKQATDALKAFVATEEPHEIFAVNRVYLSDLLSLTSPADLPPWTVIIVIRGFEKYELSYKKKDLGVLAKESGGKLTTSLQGSKKAGEKILDEIKSPGGPSLHKKNGQGWVPLITIATASQVRDCSSLFSKDSGAILLPLQAGGCFYYQPDLRYREGEEAKTRKTYRAICERLLKSGIIFPRPSALIARQVAKRYPGNFELLRSIKKAIDPENIMNPGKLGM